MQWREIWRLYLTPGDDLLILLLEEFMSKSFSFINDISVCSIRHLLYIQKGNYLFRPGNNISYRQCFNVWSKSLKREKEERNTLQRPTPNTTAFIGELCWFPSIWKWQIMCVLKPQLTWSLHTQNNDITQGKLHYFYVWRNSVTCEVVKHARNCLLIKKLES